MVTGPPRNTYGFKTHVIGGCHLPRCHVTPVMWRPNPVPRIASRQSALRHPQDVSAKFEACDAKSHYQLTLFAVSGCDSLPQHEHAPLCWLEISIGHRRTLELSLTSRVQIQQWLTWIRRHRNRNRRWGRITSKSYDDELRSTSYESNCVKNREHEEHSPIDVTSHRQSVSHSKIQNFVCLVHKYCWAMRELTIRPFIQCASRVRRSYHPLHVYSKSIIVLFDFILGDWRNDA